MSKAYRCDICNSFYDNDGFPTATQKENLCNYIRLNNRVFQLVEYNTKYDIDICPKCTEKLQETVDYISTDDYINTENH